MGSASHPLAPTTSWTAPDLTGADRWRWLRALLILPLPLWLIISARRRGIAAPLLDQLPPHLVTALAATAAGLLTHMLVTRLTRHGMPAPAAAYTVTAPTLAGWLTAPVTRWDLSSAVALTLIAAALGGYLRFVTDGQTLGGFLAGIALATAAVCDLSTLGYLACFAAAVPFLAGPWARHMSATTAILAVLAYPSIAVYLGWLYIQWRFGATLLTDVTAAPTPATPDPAAGLITAVTGLAHTPLYPAVAIAVAVHARPALPAYLLPAAMIALLTAAGIGPSPLLISLLYTAVALTAITSRLPRRTWLGLTALATLQTLLTFLWPP